MSSATAAIAATLVHLMREARATSEALQREILAAAGAVGISGDDPDVIKERRARIERARQVRDVAARALRLALERHERARLEALRGHPQAGGLAT